MHFFLNIKYQAVYIALKKSLNGKQGINTRNSLAWKTTFASNKIKQLTTK